MPGLGRELVEHRLSIKANFRPYKQGAQNFKPEIVRRVKEAVDRLLQPGSYSYVAMQIGFPSSSRWRRRTWGRYGYAWTLETSTEPLQRMST
jgi:hypothetical protein